MIPIKRFKNKVWRIIPSRFPPIHIFEKVADKEDFEALYQLESRTNDRLREEVGDISLVAPEDRIYGAGTGYIMAAFTHLNPEGSRFSDGTYGVFYCAKKLDTSIAETRYRSTKFLGYTNQKPQELDMRVLTAKLNAELHDITDKKKSLEKIYNPGSYNHSQAFAKEIREDKGRGIAYSSVRHKDGICFAVFRPNALSECVQERHLRYHWDGEEIDSVYELKQIV